MQNTLTATLRNETGKVAARQLRRSGQIPGVCYGPQTETFNVAVDPDALRQLIKSSPLGRNTVIELQTNGASHHVMVQDLQRDPVKRSLVHVDFRLVKDEDETVVDIPIIRVGRSRAERNGGRIMGVRRTVEVRCKVKDIPEAIEVDITELTIGDAIRASELPTPEGVEVFYTIDFVVISAIAPRGLEEGEEEEEEEEEGEGEGLEGADAATEEGTTEE